MEYVLVGPLPRIVRVYRPGNYVWFCSGFSCYALPKHGMVAVWETPGAYYVAMVPGLVDKIRNYSVGASVPYASALPPSAVRVRKLFGKLVTYEPVTPGEEVTAPPDTPIDDEYIWDGAVREVVKDTVVWEDPNPGREVTISSEPTPESVLPKIRKELEAEFPEGLRPAESQYFPVEFVKVFFSKDYSTPLGSVSVTYGIGTQTEDFDGNRPKNPAYGHIVVVEVYERGFYNPAKRYVYVVNKELTAKELSLLLERFPITMINIVPKDMMIEAVRKDPRLAIFVNDPPEEVRKIYAEHTRKKLEELFSSSDPEDLMTAIDEALQITKLPTKLVSSELRSFAEQLAGELFKKIIRVTNVIPLVKAKTDRRAVAHLALKVKEVLTNVKNADAVVFARSSGEVAVLEARREGSLLVTGRKIGSEWSIPTPSAAIKSKKLGAWIMIEPWPVYEDPTGAVLTTDPPPFADKVALLAGLGLLEVRGGDVLVVGHPLRDIMVALGVKEPDKWVESIRKYLEGGEPPAIKPPTPLSPWGPITPEILEVLEPLLKSVLAEVPDWADGFAVIDGVAYPIKKSKYGGWYYGTGWRPIRRNLPLPSIAVVKEVGGVRVYPVSYRSGKKYVGVVKRGNPVSTGFTMLNH